MARGAVFYEGPSQLDGEPIVAIATWGSKNLKTGSLIQTWILRRDVNPLTAYAQGQDKSICGHCPIHKLCYVNKAQAPLAVYRAYAEGSYPALNDVSRRVWIGRGLRKGSYGDPAAVPKRAWQRLQRLCSGRSRPGYTHQWHRARTQLQRVVMASVQSVAEAQEAQAAGYRTFRIALNVLDRQPNEIICPASPEGGGKATCETCGMCDGKRSDTDRRPNVLIAAHGPPSIMHGWKKFFATNN